MAEVAIKKGEKEKGAQKHGTEPSGQTAVQASGERGLSRRGPASLFSLTPRDFFTASPFELMRRFTEDMDRLFEGAGAGWGGQAPAVWSPAIEVSEQDGQFTVCAELPGLNKEDVKVELTQDGLTISGERKRTREERREGIYRSERSYGSFFRTIPIPDEAQVDQAKATFADGILTVAVPVPESKRRRREIPIEAGGKGGTSPEQTEQQKAA